MVILIENVNSLRNHFIRKKKLIRLLRKNIPSGFNSKITCNYCKKLDHIVKDCRKLKYNDEQKIKQSEGSSGSAAIKTIEELKKNNRLMFNESDKQIIKLNNNYVSTYSESLNKLDVTFLCNTGSDLNIIKISVVKNSVH